MDIKIASGKVSASIVKVFPIAMKIIVLLVLTIIEVNLLIPVYKHSREVLRLKAAEIWPRSFDPIARFVVNIDWNERNIDLDASVSKAYKDSIAKYIWRIDDGTGIVGEEKLQHKFEHPGYYRVHLSIIDANGQSDYATCTVYFAPEEIEKIERSQVNTYEDYNSKDGKLNKTEDIQYVWVPKGQFINYTKLQQSYNFDSSNPANITSNYIESDCGFSTRAYNVSGLSDNITDRNQALAKSMTFVVVNVVASLIVFITGIVIIKMISANIKKIIEKK